MNESTTSLAFTPRPGGGIGVVVGVEVGFLVGVGVDVKVGVMVGVFVGVEVFVGVGVKVGPKTCPVPHAETTKLTRNSIISILFIRLRSIV